MRRPHPTRRRAAVAIAAIAIAAAGCTFDGEPPTPEPGPQARYHRPPAGLCERMQIEEVLARQDLTVPPRSTPRSHFNTAPGWWYASCFFTGRAEDGRFETEVREFRPLGAVDLRIYHDPADAVRGYDQDARNEIERPVERYPDLSTRQPTTGWWDTGASLTLAEELDPDDYDAGYFEITGLDTRLLVRHGNLVAFVYLDALSPADQVDEVTEVLHELLAAVLDEAVAQLTITTTESQGG